MLLDVEKDIVVFLEQETVCYNSIPSAMYMYTYGRQKQESFLSLLFL